MSNEDQNETIRELIQLVDGEWKELGLFENIKPILPRLIGGIIAVIMILLIVNLILTLATLLTNIETLLTLAIAALAIAWSSVSFFYNLTKPEDRESQIHRTIDHNYNRIENLKTETVDSLIDEHPFLLKALIHMRALQPHLELVEVYKKYPFLFTEERLMSRLYGC